MKQTKVLPALLSLGLTTGLAVTPVMAEESNQDNPSEGMIVDKSAELKADGTYTINLSAYGTGELTSVETEIPPALDIVLVVDQSGSIAKSGYLQDLRTAVSNFVDSVKEAKGDHRIGLVGYASGKDDGRTGEDYNNVSSGSNTDHYVNTGVFVDGYLKNYDVVEENPSYYEEALVDVKDENGNLSSLIKTAIDNIESDGATRASLGMEMARNILDSRTDTEGRKSIVIMFTDGQPGFSSFETTEANATIKTANDLKTAGTDVYTIGLYSTQDDDSNVTKYMNLVSSNYQNVTSLDDLKTGTQLVKVTNPDTSKTYYTKYGKEVEYNSQKKQWGYYDRLGYWNKVSNDKLYEYIQFDAAKPVSDKYYKTTENIGDLNDIFKGVLGSILKPTTTVELTAEAVLRDIMAAGFELTDNSKVTVYTRNGSKTNDKAPIVWDEPVETDELTVSKNVETNTVEVTGFNYKEKYISADHDGQQLIVRIDGVEATDEAVTNGLVATNTETSGIYPKSDSATFIKFPVPETVLTKKAYVVDYAQKINVTDDSLRIGNMTGIYNNMTAAKSEPVSEYGKYNAENGKATYQPNTMKWQGVDSAYLLGETAADAKTQIDDKAFPTANDNYIWGKVSVIPANNVYYEDDFTTNNREETGKIIYSGNVAKGESKPGDYVPDGVHGYWTDNSKGNDSADGTTNISYEKGNAGTANFSFTGTGVDIFGRTNSKSGTIQVTVKDAVTGNQMKKSLINTNAQNGDYYNVPVFNLQDLPYGEYSVTLAIKGSNSKGSVFAVDGIRIYNPMGDTAQEEYTGEYHARFSTIRHNVTGNVGFADSDDNGNAVTAFDYDSSYVKSIAPMNEVYLANGQFLTFKAPKYSDGSTPDKYYVALKAVDGQPVNVSFGAENNTRADVPVAASSIGMYYEVTPVDGYITIRNAAPVDGTQNLLSVTKIRIAKDNHAGNQMKDTTVSYDSITETESIEAAVALMSLPVAEEIEAPVEEDVVEQEPIVDELPENNDSTEFVDEEEVEVDNSQESDVESNKNTFNGFSFLKSLFNWR